MSNATATTSHDAPATAARVVLLAVLGALAAVVWHWSQRSDAAMLCSVLDDGAYFAKLARNLVHGNGYSLDGIHATNGVQPLWAGVVVVLAWFVADDLLLLRAMVLVGGLCWLSGAAVVARLLRSSGPVPSVAAAIGFALAGIESRRACTGMENGLHGLVLLLALWAAVVATKSLGCGRERRAAFWFGCGCAAIALNRVEFGLLVVLLAGAWFVAAGRRLGWPAALRLLPPFGLPLLVGALAWAIPSLITTGAVVPISGTAKAFANTVAAAEAAANGTAVGFIDRWFEIGVQFGMHAVYPQVIGFTTTVLFGAGVFGAFVGWDTLLYCFLGLLALLIGLGLISLWRPAAAGRMLVTPLILLIAFVCVHTALYAAVLGYHAVYSGWHSVGEITCIWLLVGRGLGRLRGFLRGGPQLALAAFVVAPLPWLWTTWWSPTPAADHVKFSHVIDCGHWLQRHLPPGTRVGAANAGLIALVADRLHVTNLDGLVNSPAFFRDYYRQGRTARYLRDEGIGYVGDTYSIADWRSGKVTRQVGPHRRVLWFRRAAGDNAACVFELDHAPAGALQDPLAEILFRAGFEGSLPVVGDAELPGLPVDQRVVASFFVPPDGPLRHVVMSADAARAALRLDADSAVTWLQCEPAHGVRLVAVDLPLAPVLTGGGLGVTVFCQIDASLDGPLEVAWRLGGTAPFDAPAEPGVVAVVERLAHGTVGAGPLASGRIAHCTVLRLPIDLAAGERRLRFAVRPPGGTWIETVLGTVELAR